MTPPREAPRHPDHRGPQWLVQHSETVSPQASGSYIAAIGERLASTGSVTINGQKITPSEQVNLRVLHEQMPHGSLKLKLELEWEPDSGIKAPDSLDIA